MRVIPQLNKSCIFLSMLDAVFPLAACSRGALAATWDGYAGNAQHSALSGVASQPLDVVHWQTPVDLDPQFSGDELLIHYGSPVITAANTVIVPVKTGSSGGFELNAFNGSTGALKWQETTDYTLPPQGQGATYNWTPSYGPTLATGTTVYYAGAGGTVYERSLVAGFIGECAATQEAFYGTLANYEANKAAYNAGNWRSSTPITADKDGNIYFGYQTSDGCRRGGLTNGVARISASGQGSFYQANQLQVGGNSAGMNQVVTNSAPAVTADGKTVYVAMSSGEGGGCRLVAMNAATMMPKASVAMLDPKSGGNAPILNEGTASPMIGPDGDVYMGVFDGGQHQPGLDGALFGGFDDDENAGGIWVG